MITKRIVTGKIEILEDSQILIREDTIIEEDGKELIRTYHRRVLSPGDDVSGKLDNRIIKITSQIWTPTVISDFQNKLKGSIAGVLNA